MVDPNPLFTIGVDLNGIPAKIDSINSDVVIVKDQLDPTHVGSLAEHVTEELDPATVDGLKSNVGAVKNQLDRYYPGSMANQLSQELDSNTANGLKSNVEAVKNQLDEDYPGSMANQLTQELDPRIADSLKSDVTTIRKWVDWHKPDDLKAQLTEINTALTSLRREVQFSIGLQRHIFWLAAGRPEKLDDRSIERALTNADNLGQLVTNDHHRQLRDVLAKIYPPE